MRHGPFWAGENLVGTVPYGIAPEAALPPGPDEQVARAERLRLAQQARQARESDVFVQLRQPERDTSPQSTLDGVVEDKDSSEAALRLDPDIDPNHQQRKLDFVGKPEERSIYNAHTLQEQLSPYEILAGSIIPASLVTGLNSDLPGRVLAQVTENVYDTATGKYLLIPQGTRVIGSYDSVVAHGQSRALVVWERLILPNGKSLQIANHPL